MTDEHKQFLVTYFQRHHNLRAVSSDWPKGLQDYARKPNSSGLIADGIYGPKTAAEIDKYLPKHDRMQDAWQDALYDVGKGGDGVVNNQGDYIDKIRSATGLSRIDGQSGAWCAVAVSFWLQTADVKSRGKSRSATILCLDLEDLGWEELDDAAEMKAGEVCVGLYSSGGQNRGRHVRLVKRVLANHWEYIGGNERGDKVRHTTGMPEVQVERKLIALYRCPA